MWSAAESEYVLTGTGPFADFAAQFDMAFELIGKGSGVTPANVQTLLWRLGKAVWPAGAIC